MTHAGPGNIARAEAALFALMFGKNLAEPVSPFEAEGSKKAASTAGGSSRHRHSSTYDKDGSLVHLGRKCLWLRAKDSSVCCKKVLLVKHCTCWWTCSGLQL